MTPKISLRGVSKSFNSHSVLKDLSVSVEEGESLVIIGSSGCGKSVTLKCILGLLKPDAGTVTIDGVDMLQEKSAARVDVMHKIGMLFQGGALFDSLPVWENITFALLNQKKIEKKDAKDFAVQLLEEVGLSADVIWKYPAELSGGMQKRVALARAIAPKPEIIFFDEPTAGLDPIMCSVIDSLIKQCTEKLGATTITITHDLRSLHRIADTVALMYDGQILWTGPLEKLDKTSNPYVKQFIHGDLKGPMTHG